MNALNSQTAITALLIITIITKQSVSGKKESVFPLIKAISNFSGKPLMRALTTRPLAQKKNIVVVEHSVEIK